MQIIIDRFEGEFVLAELESGEMAVCPRSIFPKDANEGDIISITVEKSATDTKKKEIQTRMDKLFKD